MDDRPVREGMRVYTADGKLLGKVEAVGDTRFMVEKGLWIPHEWLAEYADIEHATSDTVYLHRRFSELREYEPEHYSHGDLSAEPVNQPGGGADTHASG